MNPRPKKLKLLRWMPEAWIATKGPKHGRGSEAGKPPRKRMYLTFDDGPTAAYTPPLLDLLAQHGARASFFVIGDRAQTQPEIMRRIVAEGHTLGNHSWNHRAFDKLPTAQQMAEIDRTETLLRSYDQRARHDFRPPRGILPYRMVVACVRSGRRIAYWSYDTLDYSKLPVERLIDSAKRHPPVDGDVLLMHDDSGLCLDFLKTMLPVWAEVGFDFYALPQRA